MPLKAPVLFVRAGWHVPRRVFESSAQLSLLHNPATSPGQERLTPEEGRRASISSPKKAPPGKDVNEVPELRGP